MKPPDSVLVLRFSSLGDVVLTSPAIEALHRAWPSTRILFAIKAEYAPLVRHNPFVHEVLPIGRGEGLRAYAKRIQERKPDVVLDLHGKIRSRLLRLLLPQPVTVWQKRDFSDTVAVKLRLRPYRAKMTIAERYHAAVEELVGQRLPRCQLRYFLGPGEAERAGRLLQEAGVEPSRPRVVLSPSAAWETKRWPVDRFGALGRRLREAGFQVMISGVPSEAELCRQLAELTPGAVNLCGRVPLDLLGGCYAGAAAFVGNDSGPMHVARALGVPSLVFFGPTDPAQFDWTGNKALFAGVPCSPCSFFGHRRCPEGHFRCMLDLDVDQAWRALEPLLSLRERVLVNA